ncbi:DUF6314 family protein [Streptomyces griseoviridis]|jgi:hypothetical protein|uniref:DUF6314 domain-containing protein n=4 Tax=Streptomyces TaxID=1883 RepID=A0A918LE82_STRGD|nr:MULTISPECIES: DUF6314 family protein [Streptomyces]GGU42811.1 hypothetical protein GCM10010259_37180 [Streptomyces daghestanicus]MDP9680784.1 hypothetical protein [Streptomyces griseoviridis]GGS34984.1 hypothetical protein GCM10010238_25470 [Streptomyces niveoruber]GGS97646.1 hypothetical protein GCM10010240_33730 [Streptomyces griseoviridis]GHI28675.1 hypothetical protein Sdagh_04050 [Streptomyces daghestanicus]
MDGRADGFWPVPDVLAYLAGSWRVERSVRDLASGDEGRFAGTTVFRPPAEGAGLLHLESGAFTWRGVTRPAERTLRFLPGAAPGTADVRFADGRPFHGLDLATGRCVADHPCAADLYRGEFTVAGADRWRTVWRVGGPAKDLLLATDYVREAGGAGTGSAYGIER